MRDAAPGDCLTADKPVQTDALHAIPVLVNQDDVVRAHLAHATAAGDRHPPLWATRRIEHHGMGWQRAVTRVLLDPQLTLRTRLHRLERWEPLRQVLAVFRIREGCNLFFPLRI